MHVPTLFVSKRVVLDGSVKPAGILVNNNNGKISKIIEDISLDSYANEENAQIIDVGDHVIMAGIVDSHVHVNEPGRTEWEGYVTATKAAAAGGITTIIDMPLNSIPPTTTVDNFKTKINVARDKAYVDIGFWGGLIPGNTNELVNMAKEGVVGFKGFMGPSGVEEFPEIGKEDIEKALEALEGTNAVLAFHAEVEEDVPLTGDVHKYQTFLKSRPPSMEINAVKTVAELCSNHTVHCHIVHVSAAGALPIIETAKKNGCKLTAETCHHYLTLDSESVPDNNTQYKCCPPIRESANRDQLWTGLKSGILDMVVSDHSPCTPDLKHLNRDDPKYGDFMSAWGGISSVQFGLSLFWSGARKHGLQLWDVGRYMSAAPAKLCGLDKRKGALKEGYDADLVVWDPETSFRVEEPMIFHKNKVTPYLGNELYGKVIRTIVRGHTVYDNGKHSEEPLGHLLLGR